MIVLCSHCGKQVEVNGLGRKPLNIVVNNVYDALRLHCSVMAVADELQCSRAYIYKVLKADGLTVQDVIKGLASKDNTMLQNGGFNDGQ